MCAPRTFYAGLFKQIKLRNFFYKGYFIPSAADDVAYMCAIMEMAPAHTKCLSEVLYIINDDNPIREAKIIPRLQIEVHEHLKSSPKNAPLQELGLNKVDKSPIDVVILSKNRPENLKQAILLHKQLLQGAGTFYVLYNNPKDSETYEVLTEEFPDVQFIDRTSLGNLQRSVSIALFHSLKRWPDVPPR